MRKTGSTGCHAIGRVTQRSHNLICWSRSRRHTSLRQSNRASVQILTETLRNGQCAIDAILMESISPVGAAEVGPSFAIDFGKDFEGVRNHLETYSTGTVQDRLREFDGPVKYEYDWSLNE